MKTFFILTFFSSCYIISYGQNNYPVVLNNYNRTTANDTPILKAAGPQYAASGWKKFWWGEHYRREWTTPVSFPVLHISSIDGGLTPLKVGGGHESKSLRLLSANGREYVLRTMDKSLDALVPAELKGTFLNDIVNDQISMHILMGPLLFQEWQKLFPYLIQIQKYFMFLMILLCSEFRNIFANKLALLEERPSGKGWEHSDLFANAEDIVNSEKCLDMFLQVQNILLISNMF